MKYFIVQFLQMHIKLFLLVKYMQLEIHSVSNCYGKLFCVKTQFYATMLFPCERYGKLKFNKVWFNIML